MWLPITTISMLMCAFSEMVGKKSVSHEQECCILKLRIGAIFASELLHCRQLCLE